MKRIIAILLLLLPVVLNGQIKPGDPAPGFTLESTKGGMISLDDFSKEKGIILIFTSNACPFTDAYESRMIVLHNRYASQGYPVVAINPNSEKLSPDDSMEKMKERAAARNYPFSYLKDSDGKVSGLYGARRTPEVFLLTSRKGVFYVAYTGSIDDNAMDASLVGQRYVEQALMAVYTGKKPENETTRAVGCAIKTEKQALQ
ncbi:MAG: thioredoxin family protein [Bacteroidota bacterium]